MGSDPIYPLFPVVCFVTTFMLLLVMTTSAARQNWNLGVTFLCFWISVLNFTAGINAIVWANNADIKALVWGDISSHIQGITAIVKPACTLIITRRLYKIASLQSVEPPSSRERHLDLLFEWGLGLILPIIIAGPITYVVQVYRFQVIESVGPQSALGLCGLSLLLVDSWLITLPLASICLYWPRVIRVFYLQRKDMNQFLQSRNSTMSRNNYLRVFLLASVDLLVTLPIGILAIVTAGLEIHQYLGDTPLSEQFYPGWTAVHANFAPVATTWSELETSVPATFSQLYLAWYSSPIVAIVIFSLFGLTQEARATYWRGFCRAAGLLGWKPTPRKQDRPELATMEFGARPVEITFDVEQGYMPSFIAPGTGVSTEKESGEHGSEPCQAPHSPTSPQNPALGGPMLEHDAIKRSEKQRASSIAETISGSASVEEGLHAIV